MRELNTDILIVGGGTGGVAAALAVARAGRSCIMTEPTDWIGGQLTSQAVPPDENRWIEGLDGVQGATRSYLEYRQRVRQWYRGNRPLTETALANDKLNPGNGWVSHLCHEPAVGHAVLQGMVAEYVAAGRITILLKHAPVSADIAGDSVRAVQFTHLETDDAVTITAKYILDATETGDLLALADIEHAIGAEHRDEHGEPHGRADKADPTDQQAISWCFAIEHRAGEDHTIDKPASYAFWRDFVPQLNHPWPGKLFSWTVVGGDEHTAREFRWVPWPDEPRVGELEMWRYRRIVDTSIYRAESRSKHPDVALINMVQMDYFLKPTLGVSKAEQQEAFEEARQQSLCWLYWMQTEGPRHDDPDKVGYPGLKLRGDELGTSDGFAKFPYIREARRLRAKFVVTERDVDPSFRASRADVPQGLAEPFADSVGIGHYRLDLHPSTAMRGSIYVPTAPFRIPLGALVPQRVRNVLAAGKCLGVTHITNGCYRLHPVEWNVGESAGACAAFCLLNHTAPHAVHADRSVLRQFQAVLAQQDVALAWPWDQSNLS